MQAGEKFLKLLSYSRALSLGLRVRVRESRLLINREKTAALTIHPDLRSYLHVGCRAALYEPPAHVTLHCTPLVELHPIYS